MIHITYDTDDNEVKEKSDPLAVNLKMCPFKMDSIRMGGRGLLICSPRNEKKNPEPLMQTRNLIKTIVL